MKCKHNVELDRKTGGKINLNINRKYSYIVDAKTEVNSLAFPSRKSRNGSEDFKRSFSVHSMSIEQAGTIGPFWHTTGISGAHWQSTGEMQAIDVIICRWLISYNGREQHFHSSLLSAKICPGSDSAGSDRT